MNSTVLLDPGHKSSVFQSGCVCAQRGDCTRYGGDRAADGKKTHQECARNRTSSLGKACFRDNYLPEKNVNAADLSLAHHNSESDSGTW